MEFILVAVAIVKTDRSDRCLETQTYAARPLEAIIIFIPRDLSVIDAPGTAAIGEEDALDFLGDRETIFQCRSIHFLALELVILIATERIRTAEIKEVAVGDITVDVAALQTECKDVTIAEALVEAAFCRKLVEVIVTAEAMSAPLGGEGDTAALAGIEVIVAVIEDVREGEAVRGTEVLHDGFVPVIAIVFLMFLVDFCAPPIKTVMVIVFFLRTFKGEVVRAIFTILTSPSEIPAASSLIVFCNGIPVRIIVIVFIDAVEDGSTEGVTVGIDPRAGVGDGIVLTVAGTAEFPVEIDLIACAAEVRITELDDTDRTVRVRVAGTNRDDTGLLLDDVDLDDDIVFIFFAREQLHVDIFKVAQIIKPFHRAACLEFIEGLALLHLEFAEDDFVLRLIIADELDIFDNTFRNMDLQDALWRHFHIRDGDEHVALLEVGIFDLLELLVHKDEVQDAALRHL